MSWNLLALDTSTLRAAAALGRRDGETFAAGPDPGRRHASGLLPAVRELLRSAGISARELDAIAVGLGPGSFTGLRVGLAAAKALAYAIGCPLVGLDSLEVVAQNAPPEALSVRVASDAQRGELYAADFARPAPGQPLRRTGPTRIEASEAWLARLAPGDYALGPALERPALATPDGVLRVAPGLDHPAPAPLLCLARAALAAGRRDDPWALEPIYLRRSAAEEKRDAVGPRT